MNRLFVLTALFAVVLTGCRSPQEPNPNDPNQVSGARQPLVIRDHLNQISEVVGAARGKNQITDAQGVQITTQAAKEFMDGIHFKSIPANEQSIVAQGFITAHEWKEAKARLDIALPADETADSLVNDRLRYARCLANLGDIDGAIKMARSSFVAPPESKWPILYAVYLEIVPPAVAADPSARVKLAQLIEDAIAQHKQAIRDVTETDQDVILNQERLILARPHHIEMAWDLAIKLYTDANRPDLAKAAIAKRGAGSNTAKEISV